MTEKKKDEKIWLFVSAVVCFLMAGFLIAGWLAVKIVAAIVLVIIGFAFLNVFNRD